MKKTWLLILVVFLALLGCVGPEGPAGPPGEINYWIHKIVPPDFWYTSGTPYGYYTVMISDIRIGPNVWIDIWQMAAGGDGHGSIFHPVPIFDTNLGMWYWIVYVGNENFYYFTPLNETGISLVIFYAPAGTKGLQDFDAVEYWKELNQSID